LPRRPHPLANGSSVKTCNFVFVAEFYREEDTYRQSGLAAYPAVAAATSWRWHKEPLMTDCAVGKPREWRALVRKLLVALCALIASAVVVGASYQAIASARDQHRLRAPGRLVEMGGYKLHLLCTGLSRPEDPTVLLESGLASTTEAWTRIQDEVSATTRVCSYDRGGIGWSDLTPQPRDGTSIAHELHELLARAGIAGKLVLVGHSSGGLYARSFQAQYPEQVVGLVLLDASNENQFAAKDGRNLYGKLQFAYRVLPIVARLGLIRLSPLCELPKDFPVQVRANFHAVCSRSSSWDAQQREVAALEMAMTQLRSQSTLGDLPLVVVTAGNDPVNPENWLQLQKELLALSPRGTQIVRAKATHPGLLLDSADAHSCSSAIQNLVKAITDPGT
jgi:pimeloyl-ACP methyl ester carboxylesterase